MAGWDRISKILSLNTDLVTIDNTKQNESSDALMEFRNVHFRYDESKEILHNISLKLERGKTYAFVGPTGGGKTTTASLIARLYDATKGLFYLMGKISVLISLKNVLKRSALFCRNLFCLQEQ